MRDLRLYWQEVRTLAASLPEDVWLVSDDGVLVETSAAVAARLLIAKSHRRATVEEIRQRADAEKIRQRRAAAEDRRKRGIEVVAVGPPPRY